MAFERLERLLLANTGSSTPAEALVHLGTPSTSIAVLDDGVISSICHSSVGDNDETVFQACSISKPIAALAIMRLIEDGHFTLESTVSQLLPADVLDILIQGSPPSQKAMVEQITVDQLMSHTAGLSVHGFGGYSSSDKVPSTKDILLGRAPSNSLRVRLDLLPGLTFSYSGGGITVLEIILETVIGKPFPQILHEIVLEPLGMSRSSYGPLPESEKNAASAYFTGHVKADVSHHIQPELAAAGLWTTPTDLLKAVHAVQKSLKSDGFLKQATVKDMLTKRKGNVGLSWFISHDNIDFSHAGSNMPGFRCITAGFAKLGDKSVPEDCGYAIMTNSAEGTVILGKVGQAICYLNKWPLAPVTGSKVQETPLHDSQAPVGNFWKDYSGDWKDEDGNSYQIAEDNGEPALRYNKSGPIKLLPAATPGAQISSEETVLFVLEGLSLLLKLHDKDEKQLVTIDNGSDRTSRDLERVTGD
ncbi:beta-lactamase/transpeptidase-like protein [Sarocladium strictum]